MIKQAPTINHIIVGQLYCVVPAHLIICVFVIICVFKWINRFYTVTVRLKPKLEVLVAEIQFLEK